MKYLYLLVLCAIYFNGQAQNHLPVIRANSKTVSIRDGAFLDKNSWSLNKAEHPDTYTADRTRETKYVTFYTDIDSIRVKVKPGSCFDFVIVYQGKDSCYTRIQSAIPPTGHQLLPAKNDTIPFTLTKENAIAVKGVLDNDTLNFHFDLSSFGFQLIKPSILHKTRLLADTTKPNYRRLKQARILQIGTRNWQQPEISATDFTATGMDGRMGWDLFDGQVVELNNDKHLLVIHPRLPEKLKGYKRSALHFIRSFPCARATCVVNGKGYTGDYLFDTGANQDLILDSTWMASKHFPSDLPVASETTLTDPRGKRYPVRKVTIPRVDLNGFAYNQPVALLLTGQPTRFSINYFGNAYLKNFDLIFDFQHDMLYVKPVEKT